jgi:hypothetical protein
MKVAVLQRLHITTLSHFPPIGVGILTNPFSSV